MRGQVPRVKVAGEWEENDTRRPEEVAGWASPKLGMGLTEGEGAAKPGAGGNGLRVHLEHSF